MGDKCINTPLYKAGNRPHNLVAWRLPHPSGHRAQNTALHLHLQTTHSIYTSTSAQKNSRCLQQRLDVWWAADKLLLLYFRTFPNVVLGPFRIWTGINLTYTHRHTTLTTWWAESFIGGGYNWKGEQVPAGSEKTAVAQAAVVIWQVWVRVCVSECVSIVSVCAVALWTPPAGCNCGIWIYIES